MVVGCGVTRATGVASFLCWLTLLVDLAILVVKAKRGQWDRMVKSRSSDVRLPPATPTEVPMPLIGFAVGLAFALCVACTVAAQPNDAPYRIGLLSAESAAPDPAGEAFRKGLKALGWVEGQSIQIE